MVDDDRGQEIILVGILRESGDIVFEAAVERLRHHVRVLVGERPNRIDPAVDAEDLVVDAKYGLEVAVFVRDLRCEEQLYLVIGRSEQERGKESSDIELGVEAMGEDPKEARLLLSLEHGEARAIGGEIELERRPLVSLPMRIQRAGWRR